MSPTNLPSDIQYGFAVCDIVLSIGDSNDDGRLPDRRPAEGKITLTPKQAATKSTTGTLVIGTPIECNLDSEGYLVDGQGARGVWLVIGHYTVTYKMQGITIPSHDIQVLPEHTEDAPIYITHAIPPGSPITVSQYSELSARLDAIGEVDTTLPPRVEVLEYGVGAVGRAVEEYGAVGDGDTDDTAAIQRALDDGGTVLLGPRPYKISGKLTPANNSRLVGSHIPRYDAGLVPASTISRLTVAPNFSGDRVIDLLPRSKGVGISNICIAGGGHGSGIHGIRFPDLKDYAGEQSVVLREIHIAGMSGAAIYGRAHVVKTYGLHLSRNKLGGIVTAGDDRWNDSLIVDTYAFFNDSDAVRFAGGVTAGVEIRGGRFERSGQTFGDPTNAGGTFAADAAGIRILKGERITISGASTDANTGAAVHVDGRAGAASYLTSIKIEKVEAGRDGGGDQSEGTAGAAFRVSGVSDAEADTPRKVTFGGCSVHAGRSADDGTGELVSPRYGLWIRSAWQTTWEGREPKPTDDGEAWLFEGSVYGTALSYQGLDGGTYAWAPADQAEPTRLA